MDIQTLSVDSAQARILDQVGSTMLAKSLKGAQEESAELLGGLAQAAPLSEGSGAKLDILA